MEEEDEKEEEKVLIPIDNVKVYLLELIEEKPVDERIKGIVEVLDVKDYFIRMSDGRYAITDTKRIYRLTPELYEILRKIRENY